MKFQRTLLAAAVLAAVLLAVRNWSPPANAQPGDQAQIKRGEYLVNQLARCGDCHTPRNARGDLDMTRHLQGAHMPYTPKVRRGEWEDEAPDITPSGKAGKWTAERMIKFLSTGQETEPPMPAYKMTAEDARAVTVYLRSLPGRKAGAGRDRDD